MPTTNLPPTVLIDVGDLMVNLRKHVAYRLGLPLAEVDDPCARSGNDVNDYLETIVDALISREQGMHSLQVFIELARSTGDPVYDERTCDLLEAIGLLIHQQLLDLGMYDQQNSCLNYFFTNRGENWIGLSLYSHAMEVDISDRIHTVFRW